MIDHVAVERDATSRTGEARSTQSALGPLGYRRRVRGGWRARVLRGRTAGSTSGSAAATRSAARTSPSRAPTATPVDAFYEAALAAGGTRQRPARASAPQYHENYYAAFVLDPDGNNIEAVCHTAQPDLDSARALGAADRRAARDPRARPDARARAHRAARGRDRRVARVPVGRRRALPRARHLRALLRRGVRRHRHRHAARARRDRGGLEGLRDERAHPRGAGARLARAQARRDARSRRQRYLPRLASGEGLARTR